MIRYVETKILDQTFKLFLNVFGLFEVRDRFGEDALDKISRNDAESFMMTLQIFSILTAQADKLMVQYGLDKNPDVDLSEYTVAISPKDIDSIRMSIYYAFNVGLETEVEDLTENEEVDLILKEIDARKAKKKD